MPSFTLLEAIINATGWHLQWRVDGLEATHKIVLERSAGPEGPWTEIAELDWDEYTYHDTDARYRSYFDTYFYRARVTDGADTLQTSQAVSNNKYADHHLLKIIRTYELALYKTNSRPGKLARDFACYKRTIDGTLCPDCTSATTGQRLRDRCDTCMGTGYQEGWSNPVRFKGRFIGGKEKFVHNDPSRAEIEKLTRRMWTANFPILEPGDILAEKGTGNCWRVDRISTSEPGDVVVSQRVDRLVLVDREHIEAGLTYD